MAVGWKYLFRSLKKDNDGPPAEKSHRLNSYNLWLDKSLPKSSMLIMGSLDQRYER